MAVTIFPWHRDILASATFAPATLLLGAPGGGRDELALALAASFAGAPETPPPDSMVANLTPVKKADNKEWLADKSADILLIRPENNVIPVGAARRVVEFCALSPIIMPRRAAVLTCAECLNTAAANALLKTLEEPAANKALILSARAAALLPPTVVSRCRIIKAPPPSATQAAEWAKENGVDGAALAFCGGMPADAQLIDTARVDVVADFFAAGGKINIYAAAKAMSDFDGWLDCLQKWTADGCRAAFGLPLYYFPGREKQYDALSASPRRWLDGHARLIKKRRLAAHPLAADLFIKEILNDYRGIFTD